MIIGIDPGKKTGIAVFENKRLVMVETFSPYQTIVFLQRNLDKIKRAVIEYSKGQSYIFQSPKMRSNTSVFGTIGRRIGQVDGLCELYIECLEHGKVDVVKVNPLSKGHKYSSEEFKKLFPNFVPRATNEHERDAVKIVYKFGYHLS